MICLTALRPYLFPVLFGLLIGLDACRRPEPAVVKRPAPATRPVAVKPAPPKPVRIPKPAPAVVVVPPLDSFNVEDDAELAGAIPPKREFRAVWVATVENIDWPSKKGLPIADQQREINEMFDLYQKTNLNAVVVQIRSAADAFYARGTEPWSEWLTGKQGLAPEPFYDPLDFMIGQAHSRGLEFHAWFNLDRATFGKTASVAPSNIIYQKPDWMLYYGGRKLFNLGLPAVRSYIAGIVANVVRQYDVDGIHFDDYFYPYTIAGQVLNDDPTFMAYNPGNLNKADWRRDNVTRLVTELRDSIRASKPWVKFGISPFGIWKNQSSDPEGSATNGGQSYYELYADTRQWARDGLIDYIVPQVYFSSEFGRAPYKTLVEWWTRNAGRSHLYIGQGAYRVGRGSERDPGWGRATEFPGQMRYNRQQPAVQGSIFFSAKNLKQNPLAIRDSLQADFYRYPALVPAMPWLDSVPPLPPHDLKMASTPDGIELFWQHPAEASDGDEAHAYLVYRFEGTRSRLRLNDPRCIITRCSAETTRYVDQTADPKKRYVYAITALDRLNNESKEVAVMVVR